MAGGRLSGLTSGLGSRRSPIWGSYVCPPVAFYAPMAPNDLRTETMSPTDEERAVASLLVTGMTDEMAARRLGLSRRTFRRRLKALMDKLGARSRFQAGFMLAGTGWVTDRSGEGEAG